MLEQAKKKALILGALVVLLWVIEVINFLSGSSLDQFGIVPRSIIGLRGILFAPFIHGSFAHLISNSGPFIVLGWIVLMRSTKDFVVASLCIMLIAGIGVWLIGAGNSVHFGASSVVFGYVGFLVSRGYFERKVLSILLSIAVGVAYGGILFGVLPGHPGISWEGHLFGFVGGIVAAKLMVSLDGVPGKARL